MESDSPSFKNQVSLHLNHWHCGCCLLTRHAGYSCWLQVAKSEDSYSSISLQVLISLNFWFLGSVPVILTLSCQIASCWPLIKFHRLHFSLNPLMSFFLHPLFTLLYHPLSLFYIAASEFPSSLLCEPQCISSQMSCCRFLCLIIQSRNYRGVPEDNQAPKLEGGWCFNKTEWPTLWELNHLKQTPQKQIEPQGILPSFA